MRLSDKDLLDFLNEKADQYNQPSFIGLDPISIPHQYSKKQDIEIAGLFASVLAWGKRSTIISKSAELMKLMDNAPHEFLLNLTERDFSTFKSFKHRTFNFTDTTFFLKFLSSFYKNNDSLEVLFMPEPGAENIERGLVNFHEAFFEGHYNHRTRKHISTPERKSACKRLNMYLRWMVRQDKRGVDFGLWRNISPSQLVCPCDLHVERVARKLKLIKSKRMDWQTAVALTDRLKKLDKSDPVRYDFALFGLGIEEGF